MPEMVPVSYLLWKSRVRRRDRRSARDYRSVDAYPKRIPPKATKRPMAMAGHDLP